LIVDTSVLTAIATGEDGWEALRLALLSTPCVLPATALTELQLVTGSRHDLVRNAARGLIQELLAEGAEVIAFSQAHAEITQVARDHFGKGNGKGGKLNFGDLMVYAVAKERGEPLLCTGNDFASTDIAIHPASRLDP
jgi:ribonuclease VapC